MKGCHQSHLPGYLDEFMWRKRFGRTAEHALDNVFVRHCIVVLSMNLNTHTHTHEKKTDLALDNYTLLHHYNH